MSVVRRITFFTSVLFIINSVSSIPAPDKENPTEKLSDEKSIEKDPGTVSPKELETLKEEILEFEKENDEKFGLNLTSKPKEVKTYLKNEEEKYGKKLPDAVEESLVESDDDLTNLAHFLALFHEIKAENGGVDVLEKDSAEIKELGKIEDESAEMKETREELFRLSNVLNKQKGLPEASQEEFNVVWNIQKKDYGKEFPEVMKKLTAVMRKTVEENESTTEKTTTLEASEAATVSTTESSDVIKEESPKGAFILKNAKGKICILAKFHSSIVITYPGKSSEQKVEVTIPHNSNTKGKCRGPNGSALLQITWGKFIFSLTFNKTTEETWGVTLVELVYDMSEPLFDGTLERSAFSLPFGFYISPT